MAPVETLKKNSSNWDSSLMSSQSRCKSLDILRYFLGYQTRWDIRPAIQTQSNRVYISPCIFDTVRGRMIDQRGWESKRIRNTYKSPSSEWNCKVLKGKGMHEVYASSTRGEGHTKLRELPAATTKGNTYALQWSSVANSRPASNELTRYRFVDSTAPLDSG